MTFDGVNISQEKTMISLSGNYLSANLDATLIYTAELNLEVIGQVLSVIAPTPTLIANVSMEEI